MSGPTPSSALSRIILTGFMGAGKSTVGARLASRMGWVFVDSDRLIEERAGMPVAAIFARHGEPEFRRMEADMIREAVRGERLVLSLGGGALETPSTRELLATLPHAMTVFLDAPLETLLARCASHAEGPVRPVLADRDRLEERWRSRQPWYRQADLIISTAQLSPDDAAADILAHISRPASAGVPA